MVFNPGKFFCKIRFFTKNNSKYVTGGGVYKRTLLGVYKRTQVGVYKLLNSTVWFPNGVYKLLNSEIIDKKCIG